MKLNPKTVAAIFEAAVTQEDYILGLMRLVHPDFDEIERFLDSPTCSPATWKAICEMAQKVDAKINQQRPLDRQVMPGGAWLNYGFSTLGGAALALWEVTPVSENRLTRPLAHQ